MEQLVKELREVLPLKQTTEVGDIVILAAKKPQMLTYARIIGIEVDDSRKDEWWQVKMQLLSIPLQEISWTLRTPQFTGQEIFTMGGEGRFIQAIAFPDLEQSPLEPAAKKVSGKKKTSRGALRVIK